MADLIPITHRACGKPAIWAAERPHRGARAMLADLRLEDGSPPVSGSPMVCAGCGARFTLGEVEPVGGWAI